VAKLLNLGYPGGAQLDRLAQSGDPSFHRFPRAAMKGTYDFSYSGLKTAVALYLEKLDENTINRRRADIAASFQEAAVGVLVDKTVQAAQKRRIDHVTISGGVAANSRLRRLLAQELARVGRRLFYPSTLLCTDNAAMIAAAGYYRYQKEGGSEFVIDAVPYQQLE
jgi:N6-L-threonylcarbamoyladenine synthase